MHDFQRQGKLRVALFRLDAGVELDGITDAPSGQGVRLQPFRVIHAANGLWCFDRFGIVTAGHGIQ
ncbi:hypothetical protein D3C80_2225200 [compost metagenome]